MLTKAVPQVRVELFTRKPNPGSNYTSGAVTTLLSKKKKWAPKKIEQPCPESASRTRLQRHTVHFARYTITAYGGPYGGIFLIAHLILGYQYILTQHLTLRANVVP